MYYKLHPETKRVVPTDIDGYVEMRNHDSRIVKQEEGRKPKLWSSPRNTVDTNQFICELPTAKLAIIELKTAKGLYAENYMQAAAYYFGLASMPEQFGGRAKEEIAEVTLLRIGKEDAYFEPAPIPLHILPAAYRGFYCCLQLLDAIATINEIERVRWREHKRHIEALAAQKVEAPF